MQIANHICILVLIPMKMVSVRETERVQQGCRAYIYYLVDKGAS